MTIQNCETCTPVSQEQCQNFREQQDKRMTESEVKAAKNEGIMSVQTKLLWGIFGVGAASFCANLYGIFTYVPK